MSKPMFRFLRMIFDVDHDFEGPRSPKAQLYAVNTNLPSHPWAPPFTTPYDGFTVKPRKERVPHGLSVVAGRPMCAVTASKSTNKQRGTSKLELKTTRSQGAPRVVDAGGGAVVQVIGGQVEAREAA